MTYYAWTRSGESEEGGRMHNEKITRKDEKNHDLKEKNEAHPIIIYPRIPVTPRYRYVVCRGVPKTKTVPVPVLPVLVTPRVYPYPC